MGDRSPAAEPAATPSDRLYFDRVKAVAWDRRRLAPEEKIRLERTLAEHGAKVRFLADLTSAYRHSTDEVEPCIAVEITAASFAAIKEAADFFHGEETAVLECEFAANCWFPDSDLPGLLRYAAARLWGWEQRSVPPRRKPKACLLLAGTHYGAAEEAPLVWALYCDQPDKIDPNRVLCHHEEVRVLDRDLLRDRFGVTTLRSLLAVEIAAIFARELQPRRDVRIPTLRECIPTRAGVGGRRTQPRRQHDAEQEQHQARIISLAMMLPDSVLGPGPARAPTAHNVTAADLAVDPADLFAAVDAEVTDYMDAYGHLAEPLPPDLACRLQRAADALLAPR